MTQDATAAVSYINRIGVPDRLIHFHVNWVADLTLEIARAVDRDASVPRTLPETWWIEA